MTHSVFFPKEFFYLSTGLSIHSLLSAGTSKNGLFDEEIKTVGFKMLGGLY
jgi:hypothetical protein